MVYNEKLLEQCVMGHDNVLDKPEFILIIEIGISNIIQ